ncbi:neuronal acetylcholine receptor subunit alpha-10-like [Porites lutea]|uniref:neuronal acetylcholine receptor subunit alpha-10-like n=1 Tax=Porites lutea TaxID=51062 RepID=UPI003CC679CA
MDFVRCLHAGRNISQKKMEDDEERLFNHLFANYNPRLRPVLKKSEAVTVTFGISLHQIIDVDEKNQLLQTSLWIRQAWHNPFLGWNKSEFGGIKSINVKAFEVWTPDIYLYNNANNEREGGMDQFKTQIVINSSGWNMWLSPAIIISSCKMDVKYFPFDTQFCLLKFGSWTYDTFRVNKVREAPFVETDKFVGNGEWKLIAFPAVRNEIYHVCCPEPYPDITFTLQIQRLALFYYINLVIPCVLITVLTVTAFCLPPESGERITLVITNLLAMTVFMLLVADIMPSTSEVIPVISIYFSGTIFEVALALLATCIILKCHFQDPSLSDMPIWVRHVVFKWMAPLLRFKLPKKRKPKRINITDMYSVITEVTESTPNNKVYGQKVPKNMVASSNEALFPRSNEINQSIVRQLSYLNLVNGNHRSSQTVNRQVDQGLRSRLTVTHAEDWCRPSTTASLCSNENRDEQHNSVTCVVTEPPTVNSSDKRMDELLKMQTKLLEYVQPRPQGFSLKKFFKGKALGTRLGICPDVG